MALLSLAIIGKDNNPIYLKGFTSSSEVESDDLSEKELFGFDFSKEEGGGGRRLLDCSLRQQFILHAALDRFEELYGPPPGSRWAAPGVTGSDAMWVGLLCPIEETRVYGYVTTTKIKFFAVVEDDVMPDQQQTQDAALKALLVDIHRLFVEYTLNPFSDISGDIVSKSFDDGVGRLVNAFNRTV